MTKLYLLKVMFLSITVLGNKELPIAEKGQSYETH